MNVSARVAWMAASIVPFSLLNSRGFRKSKVLMGVSARIVEAKAEQYQRRAIRLNDLAGNIRSAEGARKLVKMIATEFSKIPKWANSDLSERVAVAEYKSVANPGELIPDQRVAEAWNAYLRKIGTRDDEFVTAEEIQFLRDKHYVGSQLIWARGGKSIWSLPNIHAKGPDDKVAEGGRPLEVLSILWYLTWNPDELSGAREFMRKGQKYSDLYENPSIAPAPGLERYEVRGKSRRPDEYAVQFAARRYQGDFGTDALNRTIEALIDDLFGR
jgi:hypothetical protein